MNKLTAKEEEVMEQIWEIGPCAPKDVQALYPEPRPHINTVASMFQSLERKKFLTHRSVGRGYIYEPAVSKEEYGQKKLGGFVDRYFKRSYLKLVSSLVEDEKITKQELLDFLHNMKNIRKKKIILL
jgi:predicted transcriptional regulator